MCILVFFTWWNMFRHIDHANRNNRWIIHWSYDHPIRSDAGYKTKTVKVVIQFVDIIFSIFSVLLNSCTEVIKVSNRVKSQHHLVLCVATWQRGQTSKNEIRTSTDSSRNWSKLKARKRVKSIRRRKHIYWLRFSGATTSQSDNQQIDFIGGVLRISSVSSFLVSSSKNMQLGFNLLSSSLLVVELEEHVNKLNFLLETSQIVSAVIRPTACLESKIQIARATSAVPVWAKKRHTSATYYLLTLRRSSQTRLGPNTATHTHTRS